MIVVTDYSKFREEPGCKKGTHLGVSGRGAEGITEEAMLGPIDGILEFNSLEICEWAYEKAKKKPLLELKDNIMGGDKL